MNPKKMITMVKKVYGYVLTAILIAALGLLCAPCLLIFTTGTDGELTIWNIVGLVWMAGLVIFFKMKSNG
jgi:hypothetical protein